MTPPASRIRWGYHRLINASARPVEVFEDIAGPADWKLLESASGRTDPELAETIGNLDAIDIDRRIDGPGATYAMAPFVHRTPDRQGRFHDGSHGAFYGANQFETALFEAVFHMGRFLAATGEEPGWVADMRALIGTIDADLVDVRGGGYGDILDPDSYEVSQEFAKRVQADGGQGIVYPSVRHEGGGCFAAFYPDVMGLPVPDRLFSYHWDGNHIDSIRDDSDGGAAYSILE